MLGRGIEPYHPFFYEDPILPDNFDAMAAGRAQHPHPDRHRRAHPHDLGVRDAAAARRRAVRAAGRLPGGGISARKKIAALAEAHHVRRRAAQPAVSPVSTAACVQIAACIPNFALQEYPIGEDKPPKSEIVKRALRLENGFLIIPDAPGIGIELAEDAAERHPYRPREVDTRLNSDGSVMDQ